MFGLSEGINWLIILNQELLTGQKAESTLVRNVKVGSYDVRTMRTFQFELDGYGKRAFSGELRFNISDDEVARWVESYSREHIYDHTQTTSRFVKFGEYYDTPCFTGKTSKLKLLPRSHLIKSMLENTDYEDNGTRISWYRIYPKGSPFADGVFK